MDQQAFEKLMATAKPRPSTTSTMEAAPQPLTVDPQAIANTAEALGVQIPQPLQQPSGQASSDGGQTGGSDGVNQPYSFTDAEFNNLMESARPQPEVSPADAYLIPTTGDEGQPGASEPDYSKPPAQEPGLGDPSSPVEAALGGAIKSVFETKDFLFGNTPENDKSELRKEVEQGTDQLSQSSIIDGFSAGIGQFAAGMIGLTKFTDIASALPWVGRGIGFLEGTKAGTAALESGKAAVVGAVAFDPHQDRLSNLIQGTPLANPLNAFLAASPDDSAALGRAKAAMESIGLDGAIMGTFFGAAKAWKYLRLGEVDKAKAAAEDLQKEAHDAVAKEAHSAVAAEQPDAAVTSGTASGTPTEASAHAESTVAAKPEGQPTPSAESGRSFPDLPGVEKDGTDTHTAVTQAESTGLEAIDNVVSEPATVTGDRPSTVITAPALHEAEAARPTISFADEDTAAVLQGLRSDADAIEQHGGWYEATQAGHTFGKGEGIPWVKLNSDAEVDDFMARVADTAQEQLDAARGGAVLGDEAVSKSVAQMASLYGEDPQALVTRIQQSGQAAHDAVAHMEAGYLISARMFQDAYRVAAKVRMGDFTEFGSREAAMEALKHRLSLATLVYGAARSITAAGGRAVRRMRSEFAVNSDLMNSLRTVDPETLTDLVVATKGDLRNLKKLGNPTLFQKGINAANYLLINSLVSGPRTQFINAATNAYLLGARPLERMLGSVVGTVKGDAPSRAIFTEATKQYLYLGAALSDGFDLARKAFLKNDSILAPHRTELYLPNEIAGGGGEVGGSIYKPWDSVPNVFSNAIRVAYQSIGLPTRMLGAADELMKQVVYRSKVMAKAHVEAVTAASEKGLTGEDLDSFVKQYVKDAVDNAFDDAGRGTDPEALREAQIATFQQDLLPNTLGKTLQTATGNHPGLRFVLPFVKTPTNVLRYGWKMTPGLNLLQTEYRDMIAGRAGVEAQAQAVGQMALGSLFMGAAAFLVSQGRLTGGGPADYKLRSQLEATGWQPYSLVINNRDGTKTYVPIDRYDPVAIPIGIIADLHDAWAASTRGGVDDDGDFWDRSEAATGGLILALGKQFTSKTYLTGVAQALDAMRDPQHRVGPWAEGMLTSFVPFSAAQRQLNPDPYLREARTLTDRLLATVPGLSEKVPAQYDAWGDPVLAHKGLWASDKDQLVDQETQRLIIESGAAPVTAQPVHDGVDLRDVTLKGAPGHSDWAGKNAYEVYQQLAGRPTPRTMPLKDVVARVMQGEAYKRAPDGKLGTRGTKLWILFHYTDRYRTAALKVLKRDPNVQAAFGKRMLAVRDAYKAQQPKPTGLAAVGQAFGVELGGGQ